MKGVLPGFLSVGDSRNIPAGSFTGYSKRVHQLT
jgi:hypothetical protein